MSEIIRVSKLKKSYREKTVLDGVSFSVQKGEIFALLGANGAGKTTTLECMEGLRRYESGEITICGSVPGSAEMRRNTGIQLQLASLPEDLTGREAADLFAAWGPASREKKAMDWADSLGMGELAGKRYGSMSTGQQRRLHLILALLHDPEVLFLDEPTAGLDVEGRLALHKLIREWGERGKTILLATHDMAEVEQLCSRVAVLREAHIVFDGTPSEMSRFAQKAARLRFTFARPLQGRFSCCEYLSGENGEELYSVGDITGALTEVAENVRESGNQILDVRLERPSLEESFVEMVRGGKEE